MIKSMTLSWVVSYIQIEVALIFISMRMDELLKSKIEIYVIVEVTNKC